MLNDFLGNLSSRALQNAELDPVASGLRPRLASRFEPPIPSIMPETDKTLGVEDSVHVVTPEMPKLRNLSQTSEQDQPKTPSVQPSPNDQRPSMISLPPRFRWNESTPSVDGDQSQVVPRHTEPLRAEDRSQAFLPPSSPTHHESSAPPIKSEENENSPGTAATWQPSDSIGPLSGLNQAIEAHKHHDHSDALQASTASIDEHRVMPKVDVPVIISVSQPTTKVVPEQIEIARRESQPAISEATPQLVPITALPERKSQTSLQEATQTPIIHITIGRVEVRAAPPIPPLKRNPPASSTMSLDEYLRRRQEGGQ